ncbi:MAG: hypothetical protein WBQ05_15865 [Candidatus Competibacter denitrificans]
MQDNKERRPLNDMIPERCQAVYFNGFAVAVGPSDVVLALQLNGKPNLVLNTSYTVAKTLAESLAAVITELEQKAGTKIMTTQVVSAAIAPDQSS